MTLQKIVGQEIQLPDTSARRTLYVGREADELCDVFAKHIGDIELHYKSIVYEAFLTLRQSDFDFVIVDQRGGELATKLILPVLRTLPKMPSIIVLCEPQEVSFYLRQPGVHRVLSSPLHRQQLLKVVGLKQDNTPTSPQVAQRPTFAEPIESKVQPRHASVSNTKIEAKPVLSDLTITRSSGWLRYLKPTALFALGMTLLSTLYKRAAFVLLAALFSAFTFYALLIVFFLGSSNWAAPLTLTKGHELVAKAESEFSQLKVSLDVVQQKLAEARLDKDIAEHNAEEASVLIQYSAESVDEQLRQVDKQAAGAKRDLKSLDDLIASFRAQFSGDAMRKNNEKLFKSRLIDRKSYVNNSLGVLEARQRLQALEGDRNKLASDIENHASTRLLLQSLKKRLTGKGNGVLGASSSAHLDLVQQSLSARAAYDVALSQSKIADEKLEVLARSRSIIETQIAELKITPLVRAIHERIDVLFVPYGNEENFVSGSSLYSCALTIIWCRKAGVVGERFPGESASVHPFFGKPIRGIFVEVQLSDQHAATREIIHANRSPLFF
jgi:hypothetical protein